MTAGDKKAAFTESRETWLQLQSSCSQTSFYLLCTEGRGSVSVFPSCHKSFLMGQSPVWALSCVYPRVIWNANLPGKHTRYKGWLGSVLPVDFPPFIFTFCNRSWKREKKWTNVDVFPFPQVVLDGALSVSLNPCSLPSPQLHVMPPCWAAEDAKGSRPGT